jgi:hypothetical protein
MAAMPQRTLRVLFAACTLAAALLVCLPGPVHAAPRAAAVEGRERVWEWIWRLWGGEGEKSGVAIDPNGKPDPSGSGTAPSGADSQGLNGPEIDPDGGR